MKNSLLIALLAGAVGLAAVSPAAAQTEPTPAPTSKKETKEKRKARRQNGPEVYKGTVARERRAITDYPGAEKDKTAGEGGKKGKKRDKAEGEAE